MDNIEKINKLEEIHYNFKRIGHYLSIKKFNGQLSKVYLFGTSGSSSCSISFDNYKEFVDYIKTCQEIIDQIEKSGV